MTEQDYRKAMERFTPAPGLRARTRAAVEAREEPDQPRARVRPLRTGLIAACLCLALVGTAFAATAVYRLTVQIGESEAWGNEYVTYDIYGESVLHPLEDFSPAFQEDFADWSHPSLLFLQKFDSWEEVTAYLGDNIPLVWHGIDSLDKDEYPPEYRVQGYHEMYGDNKLQWVDVRDNGILLIDGPSYRLGFHTEVRIYTPDYRGDSLIGEGWWKDSGEFQALDSYAMANGCTAEVIVGTKTYEDLDGAATHEYIGTFMKDGILYKVNMFVPIRCPLDQAELEEHLHQVLDRYQ